jgi:hypothetical protein
MPRAKYKTTELKANLPDIKDEEKKVLREDLALNPMIDESHSAVSLIRGGEI